MRDGLALLHHLAVLQNEHVVGEGPHHLEIVADEHVGELAPLLQVAQQIDDLHLHRHVERRGRLVEHDELRLERHGAGDGDALALAARELVRIAVHGRRIETDIGERARHHLAALAIIEPLVLHEQPLLDDLGHRQARRQGAVGILEDDLHVLAQGPHGLAVQPVDAPAEIDDRPLARDEAQDGEAERGLAGAGFADDADRLALADGDRDAVDRLDVPGRAAQEPAPDREPHLDGAGLHDDRGARRHRVRRALRLRREQLPRVSMLRVREHLGDRSLLDDLARRHHADAVGDLAHDAEIVGDEQHGHAEPRLHLGEQLQDLRLHGDVEGRGRLVGDEQVRLVGERHGDHDALALPARELVRISAEAALRLADADEIEQFQAASARLADWRARGAASGSRRPAARPCAAG